MAGRVSINSADGNFFNVVNANGTVLLIWDDMIYYMSPDEAQRLANLLTNPSPPPQKGL